MNASELLASWLLEAATPPPLPATATAPAATARPTPAASKWRGFALIIYGQSLPPNGYYVSAPDEARALAKVRTAFKFSPGLPDIDLYERMLIHGYSLLSHDETGRVTLFSRAPVAVDDVVQKMFGLHANFMLWYSENPVASAQRKVTAASVLGVTRATPIP